MLYVWASTALWSSCPLELIVPVRWAKGILIPRFAEAVGLPEDVRMRPKKRMKDR